MIAESSMAVARALGLPDGEVERIRTASLLHDLGKVAIPDEILSKPDDLNEAEWRVVTEHPKIGQVVLEQAGALRDAATIVLHHHEWYDGRGYPHGLAGLQIPIGARIVAVADAYEAMVAGRPYRTAISHEKALDELHRHAGLQFDPDVVTLFTSLFADGMPWPVATDHGHVHPHHDRGDEAADEEQDHAALHDALHARRLRIAALDGALIDDSDEVTTARRTKPRTTTSTQRPEVDPEQPRRRDPDGNSRMTRPGASPELEAFVPRGSYRQRAALVAVGVPIAPLAQDAAPTPGLILLLLAAAAVAVGVVWFAVGRRRADHDVVGSEQDRAR